MGWERPKRPLRTCQGLQMARRVHVYGPMEPLGLDFEVELARRPGFRYVLVVLRAYPTARTGMLAWPQGDNTINGYGRYDGEDGRRFRGMWKDAKIHGRGTRTCRLGMFKASEAKKSSIWVTFPL